MLSARQGTEMSLSQQILLGDEVVKGEEPTLHLGLLPSRHTSDSQSLYLLRVILDILLFFLVIETICC